MKNIIKCEDCGDILSKTGLCTCNKIYVEADRVCPECGSLIWGYNDPSHDSTLGVYCINSNCKFTENQYMSWEEIKEPNVLEEDKLSEVIAMDQINKDAFKLDVIYSCSLIAKDNTLVNSRNHIIKTMLESLVEECNESWCDNCPLMRELGHTCDKL